jgi:hypothetical protein
MLLLVSCANVVMPEPTVSAEKGESQIIEDILEQLPSVDESEAEQIVGQPLLVLTPDEALFYGDEEAAGSVQITLQRRNQLLEEAYGMELKVLTVSEDEIADNLRLVAQGGVAAGDLLCYSAQTTAMLWQNGFLKNMNALPYFEMETACYDSVAAGSLTYGDAMYALADPSARCADEMYVLFYDRTLVDVAGLARPESLVNAGKWTYDAFCRYSEKIALEVMNKESIDLALDVFGYGCHDHTTVLPYALWASTGNKLFGAGESGEPVYAYDADTLTNLLTPLQQVYDSRSRLPSEGEDAYTAFREGRLGFLVAKLGYLKELYANSDRPYGVLPMPKEAEDSRYHCLIDETGMLLSVPAANISDGKSGLALNALCALGGLLVRDAEKETYLTLYALDNDHACMLETVLDAGLFDFGMTFGQCDDSIEQLSTKLISHALVDHSRISSLVKSYLDDWQEFVEKMEKVLPTAGE